MASLMVTASSKNSSRSASPNRGNTLTSPQQLPASLDRTPKARNASL